MTRSTLSRAVCLLMVSSMLHAGCATSHYKEAADKEAYGILGQKSAGVPNMEPEFSIDTDKAWEPLAGLPVLEDAGRPMGPPELPPETGYPVLPLEKALEIAVRNSRTYQNEKELLYLTALDLSLNRHQFGPRFSATASGDYARDTTVGTGPSDLTEHVANARSVASAIDALTGTPADLITAYADLVESAGAVTGADEAQTIIDHERSVSGQTRIGVSQLLKGGGLFALTLTSNFLRFVTGDPGTATASTLAASFTQPLLEGAGRDIAAESLTQAERDVLYAIRDFTQFRKDFIVRTVNSYYNVLQRKDIARNTWQSYQSFLVSVKREGALAREGRSTQENLGRLEEASLDNRGRWVASVQSYQQALDQFKIDLGLPTDVKLVLDDNELHELGERGILHPAITDDEAIQVALVSRLDYLNSRDQVEDSARKVKVAANALKPGLDLVLAADVDSIGQDNFQRLDFRSADWSAGLNLDLPLDRKAERNALRESLIAQERTVRAFTLAEDTIKLDVRSGRRTLEQAKLEFEIAQKSIELGKRRVREQELLAELGQGTAINLVDAQNDLTSAQNDLTSALIAHTIARLEFWRDMGILYIKEDGNWEEVKDGPGSEVVVEGAAAPEAAPTTPEAAPAEAGSAPVEEGAATP
ncbi:MAG: TolC family protein [Candidatus Hydrogenedentes bacterium]|nr:TolC family protein [Candidatus Hydrogenedentota bacterium]